MFNLRPPARPTGRLAGRGVGADTHRELTRWLETLAAYRAEVAAGPAVFDDELAGRRTLLRALAEDPDLRGGILLASPSLDRYLDGYVTGSGPLASGPAASNDHFWSTPTAPPPRPARSVG
ncbi:hypothetical protein NKG94_05760 [Micromonospora sp. M12]